MTTRLLLLIAGFLAAVPAQAEILLVGPGRPYGLPSEAIKVAKSGDVVRIDPGTYPDCAYVMAPNITIEGTREDTILRGKTCGQKGIIVAVGDNVTIRNLTLMGALSTSKNGAGIRAEGTNLTVHRVRFFDNENGILANPNPASRIAISESTFERNGKCDPECAHGIYIHRIAALRVENSLFRDQRVGHHIKSRAAMTEIIGNTIADGTTGTASSLIDIPNGGTTLIAGNTLQKGPHSANATIAIAFGAEGGVPASSSVRITANHFSNDGGTNVAFVRNFSTVAVRLDTNVLTGAVTPLLGPGALD